MVNALLVSVGEDVGELVKSISVWIREYMNHLQSALAKMDPDTLVKLTGEVPGFIIEAADNTVEDLCREEEREDDLAAASPCPIAQMFASMIKGNSSKAEYAKFEGRNKAQVRINAPKAEAIAEFFTALSQNIESAATTRLTTTPATPEPFTSTADNALLEMYRAKKDALAWLSGMVSGWFGGSEEEEQAGPASCRISVADDHCINLADGRVGEFLR